MGHTLHNYFKDTVTFTHPTGFSIATLEHFSQISFSLCSESCVFLQ